MRFDDDCPLPELVKTVSHVAFEVDDLEAAIRGKNVIIRPNEPSEAVRVAFIEAAGAPIEFLADGKIARPVLLAPRQRPPSCRHQYSHGRSNARTTGLGGL